MGRALVFYLGDQQNHVGDARVHRCSWVSWAEACASLAVHELGGFSWSSAPPTVALQVTRVSSVVSA